MARLSFLYGWCFYILDNEIYIKVFIPKFKKKEEEIQGKEEVIEGKEEVTEEKEEVIEEKEEVIGEKVVIEEKEKW